MYSGPLKTGTIVVFIFVVPRSHDGVVRRPIDICAPAFSGEPCPPPALLLAEASRGTRPGYEATVQSLCAIYGTNEEVMLPASAVVLSEERKGGPNQEGAKDGSLTAAVAR